MYVMPTIKKQLTDDNMMQNEIVQKWVNSLPAQNGDVVNESNATEDGHHASSGKAGDDMTLGAEANTVARSNNEIEENTVELQHEDTKTMFNGMHVAGMGVAGGTTSLQLLRQRLRLQQQDSFNSESSSHNTIDSLDQLLLERRGDPEKILENLGFVGKFVDRYNWIPERFLNNPSNANGISVEKFLDNNLWLKEYIEQKAALRRPFEAISMNAKAGELSDICEENLEVDLGNENALNRKMTNFRQVASTVAMVNRFRGLIRRIKVSEPEPEALVEPILRNSNKGTKFWSILTLDNCSFLDRMGYYEMQVEKMSKMNDNPRKFCLAARLVKQIAGGNGLSPVSQDDVSNGPADSAPHGTAFHSEQAEKLDKILRARSTCATEKVKEKTEQLLENAEPPSPKDTRFSVPQRFLTSHSLLFGPVQKMTGESVSEIVRRSSETNFNFSEVPSLCCNISSGDRVANLNSNSMGELPVIRINSYRDSVSSNAESIDYEWQRTSISSAATEDSSFSDSEGHIIFPDESDDHGLEFFDLTIDDVGKRLLRVPSDAASNLSSHTLQDLENADHGSDQDASTDTLQMSQDSVSLRGLDGGIVTSGSSECQNNLTSNSSDRTSRPSHEADLSNDNPSRVLGFPSKLKGVLRRQGSSQSDSSGFVDSDHLDASLMAADALLLNKVRYMTRQTKLDTISSQESNSLEEDSTISSQSDFYQSPQSDFPSVKNYSSSPQRIRVLTGDFKTEFWSTRCSVETQTDWNSCPNSSENRISGYEIPCSQELSGAMKEKFLSQPEIFTTRLYVDSLLQRTSIPLVEKTEVMLILDGHHASQRSKTDVVDRTDSGLRSAYHVSSVDVDISKTEDGMQSLTPVLFSSGRIATVKNQVPSTELWPSSYVHVEPGLDFAESSSNVFPLQSSGCGSVLEDDIVRGKALTVDLTDHQILYSLLKQSVFVSPQAAATLLPPSCWSTFSHAEIGRKQHLVEEVKLMQQALQKYRLELRVLQMQAKNLYPEESESLHQEERDGLCIAEELRAAILKELDNLDAQLSHRMRVISVCPSKHSFDIDLSVIPQMVELLKEQLYHGNIIAGMSTILTSCQHLASSRASSASESRDDAVLNKMASLEKKIEEQSKAFENCLGIAMKQLQEMIENQKPGHAAESRVTSA